jgi:hypothetical protein
MQMVHPSGVSKEVPVGFSWTTIFFGPFVPLFRGDLKWFGIYFAISVIGAFMFFIPVLIWGIIAACKYNEWYIDDLKLKGFQISGSSYQ